MMMKRKYIFQLASILVLCFLSPEYISAGTGSAISNFFDWDTENPNVLSVEPQAGATDVPALTGIVVNFGSSVEPSTINASTVTVRGSESGAVSGTIAYDEIGLFMTFKPDGRFKLGETVTVRLIADIRDAFGNKLDGDGDGQMEGSPTDDYVWSFTIGEHTPSLVIDSITGNETEPSGKIRINYTSEDPDGNFLTTVDWQYSRDGVNWLNIEEAQIENNELLKPGSYYIVWNTQEGGNNLDGVDDPAVWFRMKATDGVFLSSWAVSSSFGIDNNGIPSATVFYITGEQTEDILVRYRLSDPEGDILSIRLQYSTDGGDSWKNATVRQRWRGIRLGSRLTKTASFGSPMRTSRASPP